MTLPQLREKVRSSGLRVGHQDFDEKRGEVVFEVMDADGKNSVRLRFPYSALEEPQLPEALIDLYFQEVKLRATKRRARQ